MSVTTPYNLYHTPSRRALGDLTPRIINSPSTLPRNTESSEATPARSPLKKVTSHIPNVFADKENFHAPSTASHSKKRSIEEVDDAEGAGNAKMLARGRDESLWESAMGLTTAAMQRHTDNNPVNLPDPGSPTECATPSPSPEPELEPVRASQKSSQSFSDLLNYELCASQKSEVPPIGPAAPKKSRAELLRTRLKFGLYKVNTNQATKRGTDIISSFEADARSVPDITVSSPRREPMFVTANLDPFVPIGRLGAPPISFAPPADGARVESRMIEHVSPAQLQSPVKPRERLGEGDEGGDIEQGAEAAHWRLQRLREQSFATQGSAAVGLMELMAGNR